MIRKIGPLPTDNSIPAYLIAEIGLCHNGSFEIAKKLIYESFIAGATLVKFQKRNIESLLNIKSSNEPFIKFPSAGLTQYQVRPKLEFNLSEYQELFNYSKSLGLIPFSTVFDHSSLEFILKLKPSYLKIASHSSSDYQLINSIIDTKIPFMISTGGLMSSEKESLLDLLPKDRAVIMHCVSSYPSKPSEQYLLTIEEYKKRGFVVGFSTHEIGYIGSLIAASMGARFIERHITLSNASIGFDHGISMEPHEFKEMALAIRSQNQMMGIKKGLLEVEHAARHNYHCGVFLKRDIKKDEIINLDDVYLQQPLGSNEDSITGIGFHSLSIKKASRNINNGSQLKKTDFF